jgi:hypothetical protein
MLNSITAEWYKIKNTPAVWLVLLAALISTSIVSIIYIVDVIGTMGLDTNPWDSFINRSFAANSIFIMIPFILLLTTYICHLEIQSNGWKFLYTLPLKRREIYLSKLIVIILLLIVALAIYFLAVIASGYIVDFIYPEFEFRYYQPNLLSFLENIFKLFLSLLGIIGFQYWVSMHSRNFILPIGVGLIGFFIGFVLFTGSHQYGQYFPFAFPMLTKKFGMVRDSGVNASTWYQVSGVISVLVLIAFAGLGIFQNRKRNIK